MDMIVPIYVDDIKMVKESTVAALNQETKAVVAEKKEKATGNFEAKIVDRINSKYYNDEPLVVEGVIVKKTFNFSDKGKDSE